MLKDKKRIFLNAEHLVQIKGLNLCICPIDSYSNMLESLTNTQLLKLFIIEPL